jgi:hypothetical protein
MNSLRFHTQQALGRTRAIGKAFLRRAMTSPERLTGFAEEICATILERLWNGAMYRTGLGHFDYFWVRDFGSVTASLLKLGYRERVVATLAHVLACYERIGRVTLSLDEHGLCFDLPEDSIDALPWLFHALRLSDVPLTKHRTFLAAELSRYEKKFLTNDGDLQSDGGYAEMRDTVRYKRSSYAITMLALLAREARLMGFKPTALCKTEFYVAILREKYWHSGHLRADEGSTAFSIEGALFPFHLELLSEQDLLRRTLASVSSKRLGKPFPMKYTDSPEAFRYRWWALLAMRGYAGDSIWTWHGAVYLHLLRKLGSPEYGERLTDFTRLIERHRNFPEVLSPDGSWYRTPVYLGEEGMIWSALYLDLVAERVAQTGAPATLSSWTNQK